MNILKSLAVTAVLVLFAARSMADNRPFGIHGAYGDVEAVRDLGVTQLRVASLLWGVIEPEKGNYQFAGIDRGVRKMQGAGIDTIVATIRSINRWGGNMKAQKKFRRGDPLTSRSGFPSDIEAWKSFLRKVVERYDGDGVDDMPGLKYPIRYWQIEGEWMWQWKDSAQNYLRFLKISYDEIKKAYPDAKVVSGAVTGGVAFAVGEGFDKRGYFEKGGGRKGVQRVRRSQLVRSRKYKKAIRKARLFMDRAKDSYDILDVHLYTRDAYSIPPVAAWLKDVMEEFGYSKPIWSLENAGPFYGYSEEEQAREVVKRYVLAVYSGIEKVFWSSLHETKGWSEKFLNLALIDDSGRKKPAYFTYKLLVPVLDGYDSVTRLDLGSDVYAFRVKKGEGTAYVVWSEKGAAVRLPVGSSKVRVTDTLTLEKEERGVSGREVKIEAGRTPLIIEEL